MEKAKFLGSHFSWTDPKGNIHEAKTNDVILIDRRIPLARKLVKKGVLVPIKETVAPKKPAGETDKTDKTGKK